MIPVENHANVSMLKKEKFFSGLRKQLPAIKKYQSDFL
jgi:hypothetical protein